MERSVLVRRTAPLAVFVAVLGGLVALAARDGGDPRGARPLNALPLSASGGDRATGAGEAAPRTADSKAMYYGGEIVIPDALLAGLPTEGPVHKVGGTPATERIAALARALGGSGEVRTDEQGWTVGEGDRVLRVMKVAGLPWFLGPDKVAVDQPLAVATATAEEATAEPKPVEPAEPAEPPDGDAPVSSGTGDGECTVNPDKTWVCMSGGLSPADCPPPPDGAEPACVDPRPAVEPPKPPHPSEAEARATAQRVFDAVGLSGATITVNDAWSGLEVVADPVVGGLPTVGFGTRVTVEVGPKVQWASGFLGSTAFENDYPLLDPRAALERGGAWGVATRDIALGAPCAPEEPCPTPAPREATKVRLGLLFMGSYDASQEAYLAPAWLLTFEGSTFEEPMLALPDRYIATPPPATDLPAQDDGGAVDGSSGDGEGAAPNVGTAPADAS